MKRLICLIISIVVASMAMAQDIDSMVMSLAVRGLSGSSVRVAADADTRSAVGIVEAQRRTRVVSGFRIVIYSDNGQYAGDNADAELAKFKEMFPYIMPIWFMRVPTSKSRLVTASQWRRLKYSWRNLLPTILKPSPSAKIFVSRSYAMQGVRL